MATGRGLEQSKDKGRDEYFEDYCTLCSADGKNEDINLCVDCNEYLCFKCLHEYHNKFGKMKWHKILDKADMQAQGPQKTTERCQLHDGNIIHTFCGSHDDVCCGMCVSLVHSACQDMEYLPTAAIGVKKSEEYKDLKSSMQNIQLQIDNMMKSRQDELKALAKEKNTALTQLKYFRKDVMKRLDELEKITIDELQAKHQAFQAEINADIKRMEEILKVIETNSKKLETFTGDNESQLFVYVKTGKKTANDGSKLIKEMETGHARKALKLRINSSIEDFLKSQASIGVIHDGPWVHFASLHGEYDMRENDDRYPCNIMGSCQLEDGTVLVTDYMNYKLKRLGSSYQVRDHCKLSGTPFAVCATGTNEVAVTLEDYKMVQFVSVEDTMTLTTSFSVECEYLKGIAYNNDQLFVCTCNPTAVRVYNKSGSLLNTIQKDSTDKAMFHVPLQIAISTKVHIADGGNRVITLGIHGNKQSQFTDPEMKSASAVCVGNNDEILVTGFDSNNIIQISQNGHKLGVLLEEKDELKGQNSLLWDRVNSKLIVTMPNDHIKVFNLK